MLLGAALIRRASFLLYLVSVARKWRRRQSPAEAPSAGPVRAGFWSWTPAPPTLRWTKEEPLGFGPHVLLFLYKQTKLLLHTREGYSIWKTGVGFTSCDLHCLQIWLPRQPPAQQNRLYPQQSLLLPMATGTRTGASRASSGRRWRTLEQGGVLTSVSVECTRTLTTLMRCPMALAGRLLLNLARTIPLFPCARVTFPQITLVLLGLPPGVTVFLQQQNTLTAAGHAGKRSPRHFKALLFSRISRISSEG